MTVINTNVGALTARTYAVKATANTETAMERLSSGLRINSAADDAAGLAVANKMEAQLRGMNMAIRNSQDGISLVQTAESAMGEINNMAIRMRELAVQMNNGVYTDADRANAQLEVTALLAEIDKIAGNAAFNEVKILDGTYSQDIRAGNTNPEIINVSIDRMNTDSLGGANLAGTSSVATGTNSTDINAGGRTSVNVTEASNVSIKQTQLGSALQTFATSYATDGAYSLGSNAPAGWSISSAGEITKSNVVYDTTNAANNTVNLEVTYTGKASSGAATQTFKDTVTVTINDNTSTARVKSAQSTLTTQESANVSFRSVDTNNAIVATDGQLSAEMQNFVAADNYSTDGTWTLAGTDAGDFAIDAQGVVTAGLNFEAPADANTDNTYEFDVVYTSSTGDKFTESVTLNVTNGAEEVHTLTAAATLAGQGIGTQYSVTVDGQTVTATKATAVGVAATATSIAEALNNANTALSTPARGSFAAVGGNITFTFSDSVGNFDQVTNAADVLSDITMTRASVIRADETGASAATAAVDGVAEVDDVAGISGVLNSAANGDTFSIDINGTTITTAALTGVTPSDNFSVADLASALNTANAALGTPEGITFSNNNDQLRITNNTTGAAGFTAANFTWNDTSAGTANAVGSINVTTAGVTAVAEDITFAAVDITGATDIEAGDTISVTLNNVTYDSTALGAATVAGAVTSLNGNADFAALFTASASGGGDLVITSDTAGTAGAFTLTNLSIKQTLAADLDTFAGGDGAAAGASAVTTEGSPGNAYAGATHTAARVGTYTAATADLNGNFGTRSSTETSSAKNTITVAEAATVKFGTDAMSASMQNYMLTTGNTGGTFTLSGTDKTSFEVNSNTGLVSNKVNMDFETKTSYSFNVVYTDKNGDTFTDEVTLNLNNSTVDDVQHIADVNMSTQGGASSAIGILDSAINQISASQAKLGAIQNRLEHNIDNLSMASMLTETSKGRIIDADFAQETSNLSKQQILAQAATSMLAQANQSKQSVLALLQ